MSAVAKPEPIRKAIRPHPGPQEEFLATPADIGIFGGGGGGGKTYGLLMEPLRHVGNADFSCVAFRRTATQIRNPGGLWDESSGLYAQFGAESLQSPLEHHFRKTPSSPRGAVIKFAHMEYEQDRYAWDGSQITLIMFDQLEHFTKVQFFYMLSRNRSTCGIRPYIRATCNPDPDSFLAEFLSWWIGEDGFPIQERSGVLRWFIRDGDKILWGDTRQELIDRYGNAKLPVDHIDQPQPLSVTFIKATVYDNPSLLKQDPLYLAKLKGLPYVERKRLLEGNWKVRPAAGLMFRREWCEPIAVLPNDCDVVRYWDLAATKKTDDNNPDWTVGVKLARQRSTDDYILCGAVRLRDSPQKVREAIKNTAKDDGKKVRIGIPQDPGQAGKSQAADLVKMLAGYNVKVHRESGDKVTRFGPFSAQCEAGNVKRLLSLPEEFLAALEGFPDGLHDDDADSCSGSFELLSKRPLRVSARTLRKMGQRAA